MYVLDGSHVCVRVRVHMRVCVFPNFHPQSDIILGHVSENIQINQSDIEELNRSSVSMLFFL
jgi:hypothetical protein